MNQIKEDFLVNFTHNRKNNNYSISKSLYKSSQYCYSGGIARAGIIWTFMLSNYLAGQCINSKPKWAEKISYEKRNASKEIKL